MNKGIEIEVVYWDIHLMQCECTCSNGRFSGRASIYANHDALSKMADALTGFPAQIDDSRDFELGTFDPSHADGGLRMHFYCVDSVGHIVVDLCLRGHACAGMGEVESVALRIPLEAAAIDSFAAQIRQMELACGSKAYLQMAI